MRSYFVYILVNWNNTVMYIGVTKNLERRHWEHTLKLLPGFTKKYNVTKLVYYEETNDIAVAIAREKQLKGWRREKKNKLVEAMNPEWKDLSVCEPEKDPSSLRSLGMTDESTKPACAGFARTGLPPARERRSGLFPTHLGPNRGLRDE